MTQAGFVRVYSPPQIVHEIVTVQQAMDVLEQNCASPDHVLQPMETSLGDILPGYAPA